MSPAVTICPDFDFYLFAIGRHYSLVNRLFKLVLYVRTDFISLVAIIRFKDSDHYE